MFKACGQIWQQRYTIIAKRIKPSLPSLSIKACCYVHHLSKKLWESGYSTRHDLFSQRMGEIKLFWTEKWTSNLSYMPTYVKHKLSNNNDVSIIPQSYKLLNKSPDPICHLPRSNEDMNTDANGHIQVPRTMSSRCAVVTDHRLRLWQNNNVVCAPIYHLHLSIPPRFKGCRLWSDRACTQLQECLLSN